jgi:hypothetical protein
METAVLDSASFVDHIDASYAKLKSGAWGVKIHAAKVLPGDLVLVTKANGSQNTEIVDQVVAAAYGVIVGLDSVQAVVIGYVTQAGKAGHVSSYRR